MALTNFGKLLTHQKKVWTRDIWRQARERSFISRFVGTSHNSMIQRITKLTKTEKGDMAVMHLVADIEEDGVVGDGQLEGNEAEIKAYDTEIRIDQLRNAVRNTGRMADQKTVISFREQARDQLSYWLASRMDQLSFLTMSGIDYKFQNNGALRPVRPTGQNLKDLAFATDVSAPTSARHIRLTANGIDAGNTASMTAADTIGYKHLVELLAYAKTQYMRGIRGTAGSETFHMFMHPLALAKLKLDPDFMSNARLAQVRGDKNPLWAGGDSFVVDGTLIHEYRHVFTTKGAEAGAKWGANGDIDGSRALFCGAQSMALIDFDNGDEWDERDHFDYGNNYGIAYGKIFGMRKPVFMDKISGTQQDFNLLAVDMAI